MIDRIAMRARLEARRQELSNEAHDIEGALREPHSRDDEERATEIEGDEVLEGLETAALREIAQIDLALQRIEAGTYGDCTKCGAAIAEKRLDAIPHAALCIDCAR